ncbi:MAG: ABC transporter permease [Polyangiales bacterium]
MAKPSQSDSTARSHARTAVGPSPALLFLVSAASLVATLGPLVIWPTLARQADQMDMLKKYLFALGGGYLVVLAVAFYVRRRAKGLPPGTRGQWRVGAFAWASVITPPLMAALHVLMWYGAYRSIESGFAFTYSIDETMLALGETELIAVYALGLVAGIARLAWLMLSVSCWFLLPKAFRVVFWALADIAIVAFFVFALQNYTLEVASSELDALREPIIRLCITTLLAVRIAARVVPLIMRTFERVDFHLLVAARHLRSKKSGFLATIASLSILAVSVSSCMLTSVLSVMGGFRDDLQQKILGNHAHVVIDDEEQRAFEGWLPVLDSVRDVEGVHAATPYLQGEVMATSASNRESVILRGIDPASIGAVTDLEENITNGSLGFLEDPQSLLDLPPEQRRSIVPIDLGSGVLGERDEGDEGAPEGGSLLREIEDELNLPEGAEDDVRALRDAMESDNRARRNSPSRDQEVLPGIVVGKELARSLRLFVGDEVDIISPFGALGPAGPMPKSRRFRVAAIFYSGMYEYDMKHAYVLLSNAQSFLNKGDAITGIEIKVDNVDDAAIVSAAVGETLSERPELRAKDWQELNAKLFGALALEKLAMFVTLGIAVLIAGFCVFGTLTLMVQEKSREVGILKAMGSTSQSIIGIFLFEGLLIGVYGALAGLGAGYLVVFILEHIGIRLNPEVYYIDRLPVHTDPMEFVAVGLAAVGICLVATVFPAFLASRMRPVDALRHL